MSNNNVNNTDGLFSLNSDDMLVIGSSTTDTITINPTWVGAITTIGGGTSGNITYYPYGIPNNVTTYTTISTERFGAPAYTDLIEGIKPGDEWFARGTILKLKMNAFLMELDDLNSTMHIANSFFVYIGVEEDFVTGKERHWFLSESGRRVQVRGWLYDLGWRSINKGMFETIEETR